MKWLDKLIKSIDEWAGNKPSKLDSDELMQMTKKEIEEYGRGIGVELDRRKTKVNMIKDLNG